jgi:hypothetical protein
MSNETASKQRIPIVNVLHRISKELTILNIKWLLGASGALMVWGVDIEPKDLDIYVSGADIEKLESFYIDNITNPLHEEHNNVNNHLEFQMNIDGVDIEIAEMNYSDSDLNKIRFNGDLIPVYLLEKELDMYRQRNDPKNRIPLIEKRLAELKKS